ncbi:type II toxin-antitoxin system RelE/ParE family toxin [Mangrovibacterium diazotrophicum]|uniref:Plasmid stabilization system protein ParE n=1 Tax=Mangrovibacterium diazotrophicum TaxID=1261403 RepID=A0A419W9X0_9BACT|nr:type II toxin-antitoxin system RelE/ParE family toxin [Mangrovibacterium diazotrophicum]RKD92243.1 plasmid stabilization system protein ParE [Mangrovibacterium diazotrophicum]
MESGYKIQWTDHALSELKQHFDYLEANWTKKELKNFARELEHILELISKNPAIFQASQHHKNIRRAVVYKHYSLYYRTKGKTIQILSLFGNRQNPADKKV